MLVAYLLVISATLGFSLRFFFQRKYNDSEGTQIYSSVLFAFINAIMRILFVFAIYGFNNKITPFSSFIAFLEASEIVFNIYFSAKAFIYADMSLYSMFMMLGGMALPFGAGILFFEEKLTLFSISGFVLITIALLIGVIGKKGTRKALPYYIGIFITNGLSGVFAKLNQSSKYGASSGAYLLMIGIWIAVMSLTYIVAFKIKNGGKVFVKPKNAIISSSLFGIISAAADLFLLIALDKLPISVQYPLVTGGTIVFATIISLICKERIDKKGWSAVVLAIIASVIIAII